MTTTVLPATAADDSDRPRHGELDETAEGFAGLPGSTVGPLFATQSALRFDYVDPAQLIDNPRNLRTSIADVEDLKASMAVVGILCPLVVVPVTEHPDQLMIMIGHRRKAAALALEFPLVPCIVAPDEGAAAGIIAQLAENGDRVGLTATEEAEGFYQLTLLDWSAEKIAKARNTSTAKIKQSLSLRALPEAARTAADAGALTLDDAARMAEFSDQPAAMNRILKAAPGWGFRHAVATERSKQTYAAAKERVKAELVLAGVKITGKPKGFGYPDCPAVDARQLEDAAGEPLDVEQVRTAPGFAAFIDKNLDTARAVVYCVDPGEYGYTKRQPYGHRSALSDEEKAAREQAEAEKAARLEALTIASGVRAEFYRQTYTATKMIRKLFPYALRDAVAGTGGYFNDVDDLYPALGGVDGDALAVAKEDLLRRCLVAKWIVRHERNLRQANDGWSGYLDDDAAALWLDLLVADGYALSDAETALRRDVTPDPVVEADPATEDLDDPEAPEDGESTPEDFAADELVDEDGGQGEELAEVVALPTAAEGPESLAA
ncbi:ParB/RepB/Spo0J family partition protein [Actinoplanes sp. RD1]|uniref:ParB/RepB/Spo0J family partition protein n=1 Tax=Actinoplanes sp. RD1 TaxID=3064538 RepID=UPI0027408F97|nr:ParB N-terminal domain-containing protein [Actinoplanes sp. RD1]